MCLYLITCNQTLTLHSNIYTLLQAQGPQGKKTIHYKDNNKKNNNREYIHRAPPELKRHSCQCPLMVDVYLTELHPGSVISPMGAFQCKWILWNNLKQCIFPVAVIMNTNRSESNLTYNNVGIPFY